jgi:hypothetical protein
MRLAARERAAAAALLALATGASCAACARGPSLAVPREPGAVLAQSAAPGVAPSAAPAPPPHTRRRDDPGWIAARDADPAEKARLARAVGAAELLGALGDPGEVPEVALAALPYADDRDIALGPLAERARTEPGRRHRLLVAILAIAGEPRGSREPLDPEGARRCGDILVAFARDAAVAREDRVLAVSALRALAERGLVERARIPGDLDEPSRRSASGGAGEP